MVTVEPKHQEFIDAIYAAGIAYYKRQHSESIKRGLLRSKMLKATEEKLPKK